MAWQLAQMLPLLLARHPRVQHRHKHHQRGQLQARRWAGVHLVVQRSAQRVIGREQGKVFGVGLHPIDFAALLQEGNKKLA